MHADVDYMSRNVFGVPYSVVKALIYPVPPYKTYIIAKRNGSPRLINEPRLKLRVLQERLLEYLYTCCGSVKPCVHAFTKTRSIVTNAETHCNRQTQHLLNVDLEDFFPSISFYRVRGVFEKQPFNFSHQVATVLAHLCTYRNRLPQGAPTSPLLSNLVCRSMDRDLMLLAKRNRAIYTRYADDITFSLSARRPESLPANICSFDSGVLSLGNELHATIEAHSFRINSAKSRISRRSHRLEVTGITINDFPNVKRVFIDRIRGAIHAWEKHGYVLAQSEWCSRVKLGSGGVYDKRPWKRQTRTRHIPQLKNVLWGKLLYLRMVRGKDDAIYTRLAERFNSACESERARGDFVCPSLPVEPIVRNAEDANQAVFVIEWSGDYQPEGCLESVDAVCSQGTAFAYKKFGLITCDHVLNYSGNYVKETSQVSYSTDVQSQEIINKKISVTNPRTGEVWPVKVVHRDAGYDLAILEFLTPPAKQRYFSGGDAPITQNARGTLIGFPNWSPGRGANQVNAIVINRYPRSALQRFEISTTIRQGNSGGVFVDELYRVAGVAQQGARQDGGNDECLCVAELDSWLLAAQAHRVA